MAELSWRHTVSGFLSGLADGATVERLTGGERRIIGEDDLVCLHWLMTPNDAYASPQLFDTFPAVERNSVAFEIFGAALEMEKADVLFIRCSPYRSDLPASGTATVGLVDILGIPALTFTMNSGSTFLWEPGGDSVDLLITSSVEFEFTDPVNLAIDFYLIGRAPPPPP